MKLLLWITIISATLLGACNRQGSQPLLTLNAETTGETVRVSGTSDLPDGTILQYNVWQDDADDVHASFGEATVVSGRYEFKVSTSGWPVRAFRVRVAFSSGDFQPRAVVDKFGPAGEHLAGPNVTDDSGRVMVLTTIVPATGSSAEPSTSASFELRSRTADNVDRRA
jgi:hypothetical protein